jgi:hypothetical protein
MLLLLLLLVAHTHLLHPSSAVRLKPHGVLSMAQVPLQERRLAMPPPPPPCRRPLLCTRAALPLLVRRPCRRASRRCTTVVWQLPLVPMQPLPLPLLPSARLHLPLSPLPLCRRRVPGA